VPVGFAVVFAAVDDGSPPKRLSPPMAKTPMATIVTSFPLCCSPFVYLKERKKERE
jgi:hypothetical protein